jgi:hypothetical protein
MDSSTSFRARRRAAAFRRVGWLAVAAMTLTAFFAVPGTALGHTPNVSLTCDHGLKVNLTSYNASKGDANTVAVSIDGVAVAGSPFAFGASYSNTWEVTPLTVAHTAKVVVSAWDDPNGASGWSKTFNLELPACVKPTPTPTPKPTPTPTPEPTPTPTPEPTPTPTPEPTPTPTPAPTPTPTPEPTPTPTPAPTPTPTPTPEPTPTPAPEARLVVVKALDIDGDIATDDWEPGAGWTFDVAIANGTIDATSGVTDSEGGVEFAIVPGADGATVDVAEVLQADYTFLDAVCLPLEEANPVALRVQALADDVPGARGTVSAGAVSDVAVADGETVYCLFVNTTGGVSPATATPKVTPPPTDALPVSGTPGGDGWRLALLGLAGLLAVVLLLTPATPVTVRRRR